MKAIDVIRAALQMTDQGTAAIARDMGDAPLARPTVMSGKPTGNHTLWLLGHLAYIEGSIRPILFGDRVGPNPVEHWRPLFAPGTQPMDDPALYPPFDEVLATFRALRITTLALLDEIGDDGLDRAPAAVPPGFEDAMRTFGETLLLIALHNMVHYGQIADARRAAGREPLR